MGVRYRVRVIYPRFEKLAIAAVLSTLSGCWFMMPEKQTWTSAPSVSAKSYAGTASALQSLGLENGGRRLVILDGGYAYEAKALARVDGFDGSAEVIVIPDGEHKGSHFLLVPIKTTEPRTKFFHVASDPSNPSKLVSASELRETSRVAVWPGGWNGHVFAERLGNGPEPDLYVPLQNDGRPATLSAGLVGVRPLLADGTRWGGWFLRWNDGWSFSGSDRSDEVLSKVWDGDQHWTTLTLERVSDKTYLAGTLSDGQCQATSIVTADHHGLPKFPSCDDAIAALDSSVRKRDAERAAEEARNRPPSAPTPAKKAPTKEEEEAARIVAVEKAAFAEYMKAVASGNYTASCGQALLMREKSHSQLLDWRFKNAQVHGDEFFCYRARKDAVRANTDRFEARWQEQGRAAALEKEMELRNRLNRHTYTPGQGSGGPSAAERLKQSNDYTYGSGKASSCPFTDRSLCN